MSQATRLGLSPRRLKREIEQVTRRHPGMQLVIDDIDKPGWHGCVTVGDSRHFVRLVYPPGFPVRPPELVETEPFNDTPVDYQGTGNQFANGVLCLYPHDHGEQSWKIEYTAADALDRYVAFQTDAEDGELSIRRPIIAPADTGAGLWISPAVAQLMTIPGSRGSFVARATEELRLSVVSDVAHETHDIPRFPIDLSMWEHCQLTRQYEGAWCRVELAGRSWADHLADWDSVRQLVSMAVPASSVDQLMSSPVLLLSADSGGHGQQIIALSPLSQHMLPGRHLIGAGVIACQVRIARLEDEIFRRVDPILDQRRVLTSTCAIMIGLGSLGSHVALSLAKSGVGQFLLYDPELLDAVNVCRHVGDLADLGKRKSGIVAAAIARRNPMAQVTAHAISPLSDLKLPDDKAWTDFHEALRAPGSIIIVTTADHYVEQVVNRLAIQASVPAIYASVLGDAEHGRVFRVIPGETACYECIVTSQRRNPERYRWFPDRPDNDAPGVGAYEQPGIPGIAIDVEQVGLLTARLALQTIGRMTGGIDYPDETGHHLLWTNRGGWGFDRPLQLQVERIPRVDDCMVCGSQTEDQPLDQDEQNDLDALIKRAQRPERMAPSVKIVGEDR